MSLVIRHKEYSISKNDLLLYKEKIVVPDNPSLKLSILKSRHDSPLAGHFGQEKTYSLISQDFSWPGMTRDIKDYVNSCYDCNRNKSSKHWKYGLLQPLPIPPLPWHSLSMDFISQLPLSNGYHAIRSICHVFLNNGIPDNIVSNCGSLFVSSFWTNPAGLRLG
ncbi:putative reverse transcriptase-RNaseH-integrase [Puccinia sorghi]|uniref:Putative reverse transcriptase-RNaseH-integrase n=1 Tax=Puccinia sorghi TaxID=27349 RepID=A0A0L6UNE8_9BASI|nr:putative reverse transcriptase-RNaseH-integrase [Puccinia sorghi]